MIRKLFGGILIAGLALVWASSWAVYTGEPDTLLDPAEVTKLPQAAQLSYRNAVKAYDHIDRDSGVQYLQQAAKSAPNFVPLQFVLAARARDRARFYYGVRSLEYYDIAEEAVQRVLKQPMLSLEDKHRADEMLQSIQTERELLSSKDKKMEETGFNAVVIPLAMERAKAEGMEVSPKTVSAALGNKEAGSASAEGATPPAAPGAGTGTFPVPGSGVPLASYGVPTEKPAVPAAGPGASPGYPGMPYYPGMSPEMAGVGPMPPTM